MVRQKAKLYDDYKECLTRSSFTTFYSGFRHVPRGSTEIAIDFHGREKIVSLVLPLDEYNLPANIDRGRQYEDVKECWIRFSFTAFYTQTRSPRRTLRTAKVPVPMVLGTGSLSKNLCTECLPTTNT